MSKYGETGMKILVTAIGSMAADIVIKALHRGGHLVVGTDIYPREWIADAYNVDWFVQAPPARDEDKYRDFIMNICEDKGIEAIIPLTDPEVEVISSVKHGLLSEGVLACVMEPESVSLCRDKYRLPRFLASLGLDNTIATDRFDPHALPSWPFPWQAKPRFGRSSQGLVLIGNAEQAAYLKDLSNLCEYVVQPYIGGRICTVDVIRDGKDNVVCIARRELLRNPSGAGLTVETIENNELTSTCCWIARTLDVIGAVNLEFIESPSGSFSFLELNPRLSGGVEFSHLAGYDVVSNHLRCFQGLGIEAYSGLNKMIIARKYEEYITETLL
ncbi:MAG TPA: ATP-grasp domain-containing protein [Syntrophomonadaceae bacterium]|nr:ATP-grasp domain-containing protein [Syntrophomonadaceae bacterium]